MSVRLGGSAAIDRELEITPALNRNPEIEPRHLGPSAISA